VSAEETAVVEETADAEETVDAEEIEPIDNDSQPGRLKRFAAGVKTPLSGRIRAALLALLAAASVSLLGGLFYFSYLPDRATDGAAAKAALSAASEGTVAVLSYSPTSIDSDIASAKSHLTGDFLKYYSQFSDEIVKPAAKQKSIKTAAVVLRSALSEFHPDSAVVLLFVNQSTQSADRPEPSLTSSSVVASLTKAEGKWLISSFNPV
jgi:Mce-associated membrane protein